MSSQHVCNYAILRFLPYRETEEFVNVGVLVTCADPCLWHFAAEKQMPDRAKALFPKQDPRMYEAAFEAFVMEMDRRKGAAYTPKSILIAFNETVRIRESLFRFGDPRTILTQTPKTLVDTLFARYVRMERLATDGAASS